MRTEQIERAAQVATVLLLLAGCIPVPVPTKPTQVRYSEAQLATLVPGSTTRDAVQQSLGRPDVHRAEDRLWIYAWNVDRGKWFAIPVLPVFAGDMGPIDTDGFRLFLEFDASGVLQRYSFAQPVKDTEDHRYCVAAGFCLEHPVETGETLSSGMAISDIRDAWSAVTASGAAKAILEWPVPPAGGCVVVLWPDAGWSKSGGFWGSTPLGLPVMVDDLPDSRVPAWLPNGSFAVFVLPAGEHVLEASSPWVSPGLYSGSMPFKSEKSSATFQCHAGEQVYMAIGASTSEVNRFPIVLNPVDEAAAQALIANMPRVLLPEAEGM